MTLIIEPTSRDEAATGLSAATLRLLCGSGHLREFRGLSIAFAALIVERIRPGRGTSLVVRRRGPHGAFTRSALAAQILGEHSRRAVGGVDDLEPGARDHRLQQPRER